MMGTPDVLKILELTPGVQTSGEGKSNIYVRGGDPGQTLLSYAGIPLYTPGHAINIFPMFNADHLSTVELIKGGVNASYGNLMSGAILTQPTENIPAKTSVKGNVGLLASQATLGLRVNDKVGIYVSGRKTYLNALLKPLLAMTLKNNLHNDLEEISYNFHDANVTAIAKLSEKNKLVINFLGGQDRLDISEQIIGMQGLLDWHSIALGAKLESELQGGKKLQQQITYSSFQNLFSVSLSEIHVKTLAGIKDLGYDNKFNYTIKGLSFESGVQYKYYQLYPQEFEKQQSSIDFPDLSFGMNDAHYAALFTTTTLNMLPGLTLEPGLRYNFFHSRIVEKDTRKSFHHIDFRLFARYQIDGEKFLRATMSHNSQYVSKLFPSTTGLPTDFWVAASGEILPQYGNEVSVGYYHTVMDGMFELSSDIYFRKMKNVVEYTQNFIESENSLFTEQIFCGQGRAYGIELMLKKNFGNFTGWLSYSLGRSERNFDEINDGETFPARHDRTHDFSFSGSYVFNKKWDVALTQILATGNTYTAPSSWYFINNTPVKEYGKYNNARLPFYNRTDFGVNYWFKENNGINLSIYNVFAIRNPLYVSLRVEQVEEAKNKISISMKKRTLFTIMPSISWRFKF